MQKKLVVPLLLAFMPKKFIFLCYPCMFLGSQLLAFMEKNNAPTNYLYLKKMIDVIGMVLYVSSVGLRGMHIHFSYNAHFS
jgi:hypothetical protein